MRLFTKRKKSFTLKAPDLAGCLSRLPGVCFGNFATKLRPQARYFRLNILFSMLKYVSQFCVSDFSLFAIVVAFTEEVPQTALLLKLIYERFYLARLPFWFLCFVCLWCFSFPCCSVDLYFKIVWHVIALHCRISWSKYYRLDVLQPHTKLSCFATVFAAMVTMVTFLNCACAYSTMLK